MDIHDLVAEVKRLAIELGHTPTRREFEVAVKGGTYKLAKIGGYTPLLQAAGLDTYDARRSAKPISSIVFERPIERHLEDYKPREAKPREPYPRLASISDTHFPFINRRVLEAYYRYIEKEQPEYAILNGDAWDMYSHGKFPRSHNAFTPREEQALSRKMNEEHWVEVKKASPNVKCYQLIGNHDARPMKRILDAYPEAEDWVSEKLKQLFTYDGVTTIYDPREELILGSVAIFHGYRSKLGDHRDYTLMNTVNGHTHSGGVVWRKLRNEMIFELNSGLAGDAEAKGLTYTPQKITHWTTGFGAISEYGPMFVPVP
jgi:hypothetical protein